MGLAQLVSTVSNAYERLQVELHGQYSIERVTALYTFQQSYSTWKSMLILLATPLPCLAVIVLADVVPLNDPSEGYAKNTVCFIRQFCMGFAMSISILEQARHFVPGLPLSTRTLWFIGATSMGITIVYAYFMAYLIGFPLPFAMIMCSPVHLAAFFAAIGFVLWRDVLRCSARVRHAMLAYTKIMTIQLALILTYPAYNFIFIQLSGYKQTAFKYDKPIRGQNVHPISASLTGIYPMAAISSPSASLAPSTLDRKPTTASVESKRMEYVQQILRLLHLTEYLLLIELVEVIVPIIYCDYLIVMFFLPNRIYYPQLAHLDTHSHLSTIGKTFAYALLEFLSFVVVSVALQRKLGISPMHQLAFVIRTQWTLVQSKLILWVAVSVQSTLVHFGYDYTFRFAWFHKT